MIALHQKKVIRPLDGVRTAPQVPPEAESGEKETDQPYEVKRNQPSMGDSFIGGLDVLTVHQQLYGTSRTE